MSGGRDPVTGAAQADPVGALTGGQAQSSQMLQLLTRIVKALETGTGDAVPFASLPAAPNTGFRAVINNCSTTTFHADADGAGANVVPVYWQGTKYVVG